MDPRTLILTGPVGEGKTTLVAAAVPAIRRAGWTVGGILQYGFEEDRRRIGYQVVDLETEKRTELCRRPIGSDRRLLRPVFRSEGIRFGSEAIRRGARCDLLVIDEVGPAELTGGVYDPVLREVLPGLSGSVLLVVRRKILDEVLRRYDLAACRLFDLQQPDAPGLAEWVLSEGEEPEERSSSET